MSNVVIEIGSEWVEKNDKNSLVILRESKKDNFQIKTGEEGECYISRANLLAHYNLKADNSKPKHSHYHKDVSRYDTMDIYAICKVWNVESSGCTFAAVKKLLNAGERGAKDRITDLEQAIESIEALIKLVKMDVE